MFSRESDIPASQFTRRIFVLTGLTAAVGLVASRYVHIPTLQASSDPAPTPHNVTLVEFSDTGQRLRTVSVPFLIKTDAEWKAQLPSASFDVTRHADTEFAFSGKYAANHDRGLYRCICCGNALFHSDTKFESGTGWPSFYQPIAKENVREITDSTLGMSRTAVACRHCDAHLGHVFDDGPAPTGLRYCMNSVSLNFIKFA